MVNDFTLVALDLLFPEMTLDTLFAVLFFSGLTELSLF